MEPLSLVVGLLIGFIVGAVIVWLVMQVRFGKSRSSLEAELGISSQRLKDYRNFHDESIQKLSDTFNSLAADALNKNSESFLKLANENLSVKLAEAQGDLNKRQQAIDDLVKPLNENIGKIEKERHQSYGSLKQLVENMSKSQGELTRETRNLSQALRTPQVRGRWGEMTLHRVVELAGMVSRCDFYEQQTFGNNGDNRRPDMIVRLPNDRIIAIDAKTPLDGYLRAIESEDEKERDTAMQAHARQVGDRVRELANKSYWASIEGTPEFVVMFLPGEFMLAPALELSPQLQERAMSQGVMIATPTTLISLLHAVAYGWKQQQLTENAQEISRLGQEMYDRLAIWADHMQRLKNSLQRSVEAFNDSVGSLEHRVMVSARRFKQSGISTDKEIPLLEPIDQTPRTMMTEADDSDTIDGNEKEKDRTQSPLP